MTESSSQLQIDSDQMQVDAKPQVNGSEDDDCQLLIVDIKSETKQEEKQSETPAPVSALVAAPIVPKLSRTERERLYKLPSAPHLVVHPSNKAKGGKFECQLVSLSHILDYRKDDNKECSFEVFLFAESFNEMLIRDQGFIIYKHLLALKEEPVVQGQNKRKLSLVSDSNGTKEESAESNETKKLKTADSTNTESAPASTVAVTATADQTDADNKSSNVSKPKPKTLHPDLLLAFTYMDTHRSGYIHEKDLEDFLLLLGLNLTRSKLRVLMKKLNVRDSLISYRSLTDTSSSSSLASNLFYKLPSDDRFVENLISYDAYMKRLIKGVNAAENAQNDNLIVEIEGKSIDVMKTVAKLEASESNLLKLDLKLKESLDEIGKFFIKFYNSQVSSCL